MTPLKASVAETFRPPFAVGALAVAIFIVWAAKDGGYDATTWYPGALFLLALLAVSVATYSPARKNVARTTYVAVAFIVAYALWSVASIAWSHAQGIAWDGANRTLLYAVVYILFAFLPWRASHVVALVAAFAIAVAAIGVVDLSRAAAGNPHRFFLGGRLIAPAGYDNASCALYVLAALPVAYLGARRDAHALVRGALIGVTVVLADLALLTQSRASLVAVPLGVLVYLAIVPTRLRALLALVPVAAGTAAAAHWLLAPYSPLTHGIGAARELHNAVLAVVGSGFVAAVVWSLVAFVDRRVELSKRLVTSVSRATLAVAIVAVIAGAALFAASSPERRMRNAWHQFKSGYPTATRSSSHFTSGLGNNRYDFWRVALDEFRSHPAAGVGADNFAEDYVRERRSSEEPLYPHSLELRVLSQTGVIGAILFAGFVLTGSAAAVRGLRRRGLSAGVTRAALAATAYWAIHGSIDWFWEFPGLTAPVLAWFGIAAGSARTEVTAITVTHRRSSVRLVSGTVGVAVGLAVAVSFVCPFLAAELENRAAGEWRVHADAAFRDLSSARNLNPLGAEPDLLAGAIASRLNDVRRMQSAFEGALDRDPGQWYAHFELALADASERRWARAIGELRRAAELDPRESAIQQVRGLVRSRRPVDRAKIDRFFVARVDSRVGR